MATKTKKKGSRKSKPESETEAAIKEWHAQHVAQGNDFASLLEHPDCPKTFVEVFARVFTHQLFNRSKISDITRPDVLRLLYPLVMDDLDLNEPATADGIVEALLEVRDALVPDSLVNSIQAKRGAI